MEGKLNRIKTLMKNGGAVSILFFISIIWITTNTKIYQQAYRWDAAGYYAYLPATFIYDDLDFNFHKQNSGVEKEEFYRQATNGKFLNKYGVGSPILQFPFFVAGHLTSKFSNHPQNGFSKYYKLFTAIGAAFYGALGLFFLGLSLKDYFGSFSLNLTLLSIGFATNFFYYSLMELMMSHIYSFFLFSLVLWAGIQWKKLDKPIYFLIFCLGGGLIVATRITNIIFLMVPLFWGINDWSGIKSLFLQFKKQIWILLFGIALFALPLIPQFWYLNYAVGKFRSPYGHEAFFWSDPLFLKVLFSYRKGWFVWSPILVVGIFGWFLSFKKEGFWLINIFLLINLYVISSWWCWWYGGSFGMRALIESS
ncbi:MAG: hypothetical protein R2784_16860, partial [Saprospiraceae bacterium]